MLLHGWGASGKLMMPIATTLKGYRYIIPDFYGFGNSPHPDYPLSVEDYVLGVLEILKIENIQRADFIAHSFGGRVCIDICVKYPELVNRVVLCDSAGILPKRSVKYYVKVWFYKILKRFKFNTEKFGSKEYRELSPVMRKTFVNVVNYNQKPLLKEIRAKTLIVWGEDDKTTPIYMAKILHENIKGSEIKVLKNAGHFAYADELRKFCKAVKQFLG